MQGPPGGRAPESPASSANLPTGAAAVCYRRPCCWPARHDARKGMRKGFDADGRKCPPSSTTCRAQERFVPGRTDAQRSPNHFQKTGRRRAVRGRGCAAREIGRYPALLSLRCSASTAPPSHPSRARARARARHALEACSRRRRGVSGRRRHPRRAAAPDARGAVVQRHPKDNHAVAAEQEGALRVSGEVKASARERRGKGVSSTYRRTHCRRRCASA